ncbi:GTP-binding protein [Galdieria sulphuraria]|uniref:GTP-binding protein n=1 Tax=Galdieria sulphuraria TaxID=130081 RepID=M2X5Y1_GALSU|nr:GTP-binding protein [Galdieria sulphuraria]EME31880.1 GTP-binding protein [Galdieria sulphuraria]|eukprot:XP_005708400.1 GTP-binding protein [Galdieria sulphuraria]
MGVLRVIFRPETICFAWKPFVWQPSTRKLHFHRGVLHKQYSTRNNASSWPIADFKYCNKFLCTSSTQHSPPETKERLEQRFLELLKQKATRKAYDMVLNYISTGKELEEQSKRRFIKKLSSAGRADLGHALYEVFRSEKNSLSTGDPTLLLSIWKTVDSQKHRTLMEQILKELEDWVQVVLKDKLTDSVDDKKLSVVVQVCVELANYYVQHGNVIQSLAHVRCLEQVKEWVNIASVNKLLTIYSKAKSLEGLYATIEMKKRCNVVSDSDTNTLLAGAFIKEIHFVTGAVSMETLPKPLPEVAFVGKSNVGKSSLLNLLVNNYSIAYTSKTPGKTQQLNYFIVNRSQEDGKFFMVDLPGYGYARVSKEMRDKWVDWIRDYLEQRKCLQVLFHLIDGTQGICQEDRYFIEFLLTTNVLERYYAVLTKMDKCNKPKHVVVQNIKSELLTLGFPFEVTVIPTSFKQRWGSEDLWLALKPVILKNPVR